MGVRWLKKCIRYEYGNRSLEQLPFQSKSDELNTILVSTGLDYTIIPITSDSSFVTDGVIRKRIVSSAEPNGLVR